MMNKIVALFLSFFLAFIIFSLFFEIITPKNRIEKSQAVSISKIDEKSIIDTNLSLAQTLNIERQIRQCKDAVVGFNAHAQKEKIACRTDIEKRYELNEKREKLLEGMVIKEPKKAKQSSLAIVNAFKETSLFIIVIYLTLLTTLWVQLFIAFTIKDSISEKSFTLSEWAINSPPILGVVGTIYGFASFTLVASEQKGLFDIFKSNFYDAATTTIIGGSFYVINLALSIWISSKVSKKGG